MIRDSSDGSVRDLAPAELETLHEDAIQTSKSMKSGLSTSKLDAKELAKLERSREWLKNRRKINGVET